MIQTEEFAEAFKQFLLQATRATTKRESYFPARLRAHFDADPAKLPFVRDTFSPSDQPNLHLALDAWVSEPGRTSALVGVAAESREYGGYSFSQLVVSPGDGLWNNSGPVEGPVEYANFAIADGNILSCVHLGLYLVTDGDEKLALLVQGPSQDFKPRVRIEVMAATRESAERFLGTLRASMRRRNVYRGQVLALDAERDGTLVIRVQKLPTIARDQIVLPAGLLDQIERQTVRFAEHAKRLSAAGRHLRRGVLLHGKPGTGKTLTAMYLSSRMQGRTVLLVTAKSLGLIEEAVALARALEPATIVLEDVDLVAEERTAQNKACNAVLFELLNQMDGLSEDADILFLLTTNRPDMLEPALASRPGRIDLAVEVPLPDPASRRALLTLYAKGLNLDARELEPFVRRTEGASAAFIRELLRKAALIAADEGPGAEIVVAERHMDAALAELAVLGGGLTRSLLGGAPA